MNKAWLHLIWEGSTQRARAELQKAVGNDRSAKSKFIHTRVKLKLYDRDFPGALELFSSRERDFDTMAQFIPSALWYAQIYGYLDREKLAAECYDRARIILEAKVAEDPEDARFHSSLGIAYAGLGNERRAIGHGELGVKKLPRGKDALRGTFRIEDLALIYVMLGKYDDAIEKLKHLLSVPSQLSVPLLRLDPAWRDLSGHPEFDRLIESNK